MGYFGGSPYTLEVPVNEVHTMKISHPLHAVDKLQGSSASVPNHEELSRTSSIRRQSFCLIYSAIFPFAIHSDTMVSLASGVSFQGHTPTSPRMFGWFNDFHNTTSLQNLL